jgi:3-deoxy-D-manno-octulosonic-acid transferase
MVGLCLQQKSRDNAAILSGKINTLRTLYTILYLHLLPVFVMRLYWRARQAPAYALRIKERFALVPVRQSGKPLYWVHAVSVGEVMAAIPMIRQLQLQHPEAEFCVTTTTPTGSERVKAAFGESVLHYYLPYDLPSMMAFFIRAIKPHMLLIMETELWPNVIACCYEKDIPVVLVNGRMSEKSARGYRRLSMLTRPMLRQLSYIAAQSSADARRFVQLGAYPEKVEAIGSIKFDVSVDEKVLLRFQALQKQLACVGRKVAVFASTHPGEDEQLLPMIKRLAAVNPDFLAIVVPRHPERFSAVAMLAQQESLSFCTLTSQQQVTLVTQLVLGDTMGDMLAIYGLADVAFVGGSLVARGGHNFLEAAVWRLPILSGSSVFNFQSIADELQANKALRMLSSVQDLELTLRSWLLGEEHFDGMGKAAERMLLEKRGVLDRLVERLQTIQ